MEREIWLDRVRLWACILVAAGHFFKSMVAADLMPESVLYRWFIDTIYYFHVPLFFVCSGYLYQRRSRVETLSAWKSGVIKKAVVLGIPYFVFSLTTWGLKEVFSGSVNSQNSGLLESLFLQPASPYWYLYTLFFVFAVTPTFRSKGMAMAGVFCALLLKWSSVMYPGRPSVYAIHQTMANEIWFVLGMALCMWSVRERVAHRCARRIGIWSALLFLLGSAAVQTLEESGTIGFGMGLLGCIGTILLAWGLREPAKWSGAAGRLARYTMPIFLMHTIFAAGLRAVLLRLGIRELMVHIVLGLGISFVGPIVAAEMMKKMRLDVLFDPGKYFMAKADKRN